MKENWDNLTDRQWSIQAANQAIRAISLVGETQSDVRDLTEIIFEQKREIDELRHNLIALAEIVSKL